MCPYLVDVEKSEITGPLAQFQCKKADHNETFSLVQGLNFALDAKKLPEEVLKETFERWWPDLKKAVKELPPPVSPAPRRPDRELLEEILERVRSLSREGGTSAALVPEEASPGPRLLKAWRRANRSDDLLKALAAQELVKSESLADLVRVLEKDLKGSKPAKPPSEGEGGEEK